MRELGSDSCQNSDDGDWECPWNTSVFEPSSSAVSNEEDNEMNINLKRKNTKGSIFEQ
jgi:hypothetical protein